MKRLIFVFSTVLFFLVQVLYVQGQQQPIIRFSPEGIREAMGFEVMFNVPVTFLPKGEKEASITDLNPQFPNIINYFKTLESKYGKVQIFKQIPNDAWGDTLRIRPSDGKLIRVRDLSQLYFVKLGNYVPVDEIVEELSVMPEVKFAHQPVEAMNLETPDDFVYNNEELWNLVKIVAEKAWAITKGDPTITIGIIEVDSPPNFNHEDLQDKWDSAHGEPSGNSPHSTRVASIAGAATNNSKGIASLGWDLKVSGYSFSGTGEAQLPGVIDDAVISDGLKIINCSFTTFESIRHPVTGCKLKNPKSYGSVEAAIERAVNDYDVVVVAAAGNSAASVMDEGTPPPPNCDPADLTEPYFPNFPYPAGYAIEYNGVIAVSATGENDIFGEGSMLPYNTGSFMMVAAPGMNVVSAFGTNSYDSNESGTSFSSPHVAALAGLIRSINPDASNVDVERIIATTADKVGSTSYSTTKVYGTWNNEMGYGRINAHDAVLQALDELPDRKSNMADATAHNGGRRVVRDNNGNYHIVYQTGNQIFYAKYNSGGSWNADIRISDGNGKDNYPTITQFNNKLYAVWQRKVDSSTHDIIFASSQDGGASWSAPYVLASTSLADDPLPVIQTGVASNFAMMVIYRSGGASAKLKSLRTTSSNPTSAGAWTSADVPATGANDCWPALAATRNYWGSDANFGVAYANTGGHIHYRYYQHASGGWSANQVNLSAIVPGSNYTHQTPTLTGVGDGSSSYDLHVAWHRVYDSGANPTDHSIVHRRSSGFDSWPNEYFVTYYEQQQRPVITAVAANKVDLLYQLTGSNQIYKQRFDGTSWGTPGQVGSGRHPSVSTGSTQAKYVYTSGGSAPFAINLGTETLQKSGGMKDPAYSRSVAWLDSSGAYLEVVVDGITVKRKDGTTRQADFAIASLDSFELTTANAWDLLASEPLAIPADAESLFVDYSVVAEKIEIVAQPVPGNRHLSLEMADASKNTLATRVGASLPTDGDLAKAMYRHGFGADVLRNVSQARVELKVNGLAAKSAAFASLGHVFDFNKARAKANESIKNSADEDRVPTSIVLASHPNPFNPETEIRLQSPVSGYVTLAIYDILGKRIKTLFAGQIDNTGQRLRWDAKDDTGQTVTTGLYFAVLTGQLDNGHSVKISQKLMLIR